VTWSLHALNGLETVFRTFDFAQHITNEIERAGVGKGMAWNPYFTSSTGEAVGIPRWWLRWFEPDGSELIGTGGKTVSAKKADLGHDPKGNVGLVIVCFWRRRGIDRQDPILKPQVLCGVGEMVFQPWGGADFKRYLKAAADAANEGRRDWSVGKPAGSIGKLQLDDAFSWKEPVNIESLDTPESISDLATELADFMAPVVTA